MIEASVIIYDTRQGGQATVPPGMSYSYSRVNDVYFIQMLQAKTGSASYICKT